MLILRAFVAGGLLYLAALGCGLIDASFQVDTDWQTITVDSAALGIKVPSGTVVPSVKCANDTTCGASGIKCGTASLSCNLKCDAGKCAIVASVEQPIKVDLSQKIKNQTTATVLSKVTFQQLLYRTEENTLNFKTPKIEVFVGSGAAKSTKEATMFATIPEIPAGTKPEALAPSTDAGKAALEGYVYNYHTPFQLFGKATITFPSGSPLPQGKLRVKVKAYFKVDPT